ncbi:GntR family transcriptional regulator [Eubacterium sp. 1001713B170207_170306_E7]|uniref:GntR family transcriptional regulator n=1 Tax=Eubacterium sp. 1001713B170207_170306_E7 TaxID=2787097 RepID=UPI0018991358|nr:GntR family transcriptional regulator [Eubacterium sp. 1001713B170207_170306_E7]
MPNKQRRSNLIYEYFILRFWFQYYKYGDTLPSIDSLCREFSVSSLTVKEAFSRMRAEGYISTQQRRSTVVTFKKTDAELKAYAADYFSKRKTTFPDLYQSTEMIFIPLLIEGFLRMDEKDFDCVYRWAERSGPDDLTRIYCFVLQKMDNPLIMNLFWETSLYLGLPYLSEKDSAGPCSTDMMRKRIETVIRCGQMKNPRRILEAHLTFQKDVSKKLTQYMGRQTATAAQQETVPFTWRIYRDRPQICHTLAVHILHEIYSGQYRNADFLPSYTQLAKQYGVSVSTIRRTVSLLSQIGAVRTINGKGIRIFSLNERSGKPDFSQSAIRRNMALFIQSYEIITYTCRAIVRTVLPLLSDSQLEALLLQLETNLSTGNSVHSPGSILTRIIEHAPLQGIKEIYGKLYGLLFWGYPVSRYERSARLDLQMSAFTKASVDALRAKDFDQCARLLSGLLSREFKEAEAYLLKNGFQPDETRLSPSVRLLSTEPE